MALTPFALQKVSIDETSCLGSGSYGAVYKAKRDQDTCVAKVMYIVLSSQEDPEYHMSLKTFCSECQLLSSMRHQNIVQYLGASYDEESRQPVLLMKLLDQNLTKFLKQFPGQLPPDIELSISCDIARALEYLHAKGLIHRDISSNNVLMSGNCAKVSDFGMSKLRNIWSQPDTGCPRNVSYMPPEALGDPPSYTEKLDIFSFGVLMVQIMTRETPDSGLRIGPVTEVERRRVHLQLIDDSHSLKPIALGCLNDNKNDRPTAQELCTTLKELHGTETRTSSREKAVDYGDHFKKLQFETPVSNLFNKPFKKVYDIQREVEELNWKIADQTYMGKKQENYYKSKEEKNGLHELLQRVKDLEEQLQAKERAVKEKFRPVIEEIQAKLGSLLEEINDDSTDSSAAENAQNTANPVDPRAMQEDEHTNGRAGDNMLETAELQPIPISDVTFGTILRRGAQAVVFKGKWKSKEVAIKKYAILRDPRDIHILKELPTHPNVVKVHGFVQEDISCSIVMELMNGGSLYDFIHVEKKKPPHWQRFCWMKDITNGMEFLHSRDVAHRDLKSANVLLAEDNRKTAMLCDFGTARRLPNTTVQSRCTGTLRWMAPEIAKDDEAKINKKCDVFSYSMVLYEIVTLELPFNGKSEQRAMQYIMDGDRPFLPQTDPCCPTFLYDLINACWSDNPKDRPSFQEISSALNCKKLPE